MTTPSPLAARTAPRIVTEDEAFRSKMMGIAAGMTDVIAMGRGDPDFHTPGHIVEAAPERAHRGGVVGARGAQLRDGVVDVVRRGGERVRLRPLAQRVVDAAVRVGGVEPQR